MPRLVRRFIPENPVTRSNAEYQGYWFDSFGFEGTILQIMVMPRTPDTTYNFGIKDETGMLIFSRRGVTGPLVAHEEGVELGIVVFPGEKQMLIDNASRDEEFSISMVYQL